MKKRITRFLTLFVACLVAITVFAIPQTENANADTGSVYCKVKFSKQMTLEEMPFAYTYYKLDMGKAAKGKTVTVKIKEGNSIEVVKSGKKIYLMPVEKGRTKITIKVGKKNYTSTVKVVSFKSHIKSFKVGKKNITKEYNGDEVSNRTGISIKPGKKTTITVKPEKGWKVMKITYDGKKIKNGKPVKIHKDRDPETASQIVIELYNAKRMVTLPYMLYVS